MIIIDPIRRFLIDGDVCEMQSVMLVQVVAANQSVVAAVTGKRIRVFYQKLVANAAGTNPAVTLLSGSGGTVLYANTIPALTVGCDELPYDDSGHFETATSTGLFTTVATATANIFIKYITYTPRS